MRIDRIRSRNILGARDIDVRPATAMTIFCGFNGAGKSSIQESIRLALQAETLRVHLKKDYPLMVSEGAKEGFATVEIDGAESTFHLPSGDHTPAACMPAADQLNCVLNAQRFAMMDPDERRDFLMVLTKSKPNPERIKALMIEAKLDLHRIEMALPMLRGGFPAAAELAKQKATEFKGAWKAIAGGVWGSQKGEAWAAPELDAPEEADIEAARVDVENKEQDLNRLSQELGALTERAKNAGRQATNLATARKQADSIGRVEEKLTRERESLASHTAQLEACRARAGAEPKEGLVHDLARFVNNLAFDAELQVEAENMIDRYVDEFGPINGSGDPEAAAQIDGFLRSVEVLRNSVKTGEQSLATAQAAKASIDNAGNVEAVSPETIAAANTAAATAKTALAKARTELAALEQRKVGAEKRNEITTTARKHHDDIVGWTKVAEQFAPDGIPAQILAKALKPINSLLREAASETDWFQVTIGHDMSIKANGRLYTLLSESERWMVDAHIAEVIGQLSGLRIMVLDRFDVLDINHRPELIYWLSDLCAHGKFDQVLVFGTLKAPPGGLPENVEAIWVSGGEIDAHGALSRIE